MNVDQILSAVRTVFGLVSGYAIGRGWIDGEQATLIGGLLVAIVPFAWGMWTHSTQAKIASVNAIPGVTVVGTPTKAL